MNDNLLHYDDDYCLKRVSEGDEYYFNLLFTKYRGQLFTYVFKVTKSKEIAEEIVLDVFLKLWQGREVLNEIENLDSFLFRIAHNKAIDFFRAAKRNSMLQKQAWNLLTAIHAYETADGPLNNHDFNDMVWAAVKQLSPQRQKVFFLRKSKEMSYDAIAKELNISPHTVRNHLATSIKFIREYMHKNEFLPALACAYLEFFFRKD